MASCADELDRSYEVGRPDNVAEYGYLSDYKSLKEYVDRSKNPNFKLGIGTTVSDYLKKELVYGLTNSNFDETVAGNAMKMASCVNDNGDMDFSTVSEYVNAATEAGLSVYGHTLAWHAQQPMNWLNKLIADRPIEVDPNEKIETLVTTMTYTDGPFPFYPMGCEPPVINGALHFEPTGDWSQFFICPGGNNVLTEGDYRVYLEITSSAAADGVQLTLQNGWGDAQNVTVPVPIVEGHETYELNFPGLVGGNYDCILKPQTAMATLDVHSIKVTKLEAPAMEIFVDQVDNSAMEEGKSMNNFIVREKGKGDVPGSILVGQGPDGMNCTAITSVANPENTWDTQFFIVANKAWEGGAKYKISFWYRATAEAGCETQCHGDPGGYMHWAMLPQNPNFTTEWQYYEATSTIPAEGNGMKTIAFNLNVNPNVVTYYFADIKWQSIETGNTIPLTPEEKRDTLIWAMDKWISGMMTACDGNVKAWDVVNEAISGGNSDGEGVYALQHGAEDNKTDFFWQDHMGDLEYVRTAVRLAREYGPEDIKLFVNDYNLESDWDQNGKLKSLIKWIERWEADGETKIDGIGTQMHISCYANPQTQASKKAAIENMFRLMAATGKLVRVSELDMGYVDADGNSVKTVDMTEEQHHEMAELYKFVIQKYLEIIPVDQQWGITQWCATDSPANSGWRAGEPVGLWDLNYNRKHTYAGFADGLSGK